MTEFVHATFDGFFDSRKVEDALDRKEKRVMTRAAGYGRQAMRRGMRRRKGPGPEGGYPNAHGGELRNKIFYNYNQSEGAAIIGPIRFATQPNYLPSGIETIPQLLNEGATLYRPFRKKKLRQVYKPRPFVELTLPIASAKWVELYEQTTLRS